ncbi:alpha/beta fold hydrolase [Shewanella profunda]|uniref:alpha/beta fold hydrolase n=1 Tax=Shewanella profunda TaxID=254793 RepID=UPI00200BB1B4|nr:alpha/beta hydrolase [Shewanella profunda]MCL1091093.1 alpha/beta fold hydrolase [Shewanella profunda]
MQIVIKMLGELQVFHNNQLIPLPSSKLTRALMVYLLLNPRAQRRDHLCALFWPETKDARGALRWSLSKLRNILNNHIERVVTDHDSVSINTADIDIDIDIIHLSVRALQQHSNAAEVTKLGKELAIPLLDGLDLHNCPEFQHWLVAQRQQLIELHRKVLGHNVSGVVSPISSTTPKTAALSAWTRQALTPNQTEIHFCAGNDGVNIAYASVGQGWPIVKPPAFMNHLQYDWQAPLWGHILHTLAKNHQLIRYDDRGSGMSERNISDVCVEDLQQDLVTVVAANNLSKFALLGIGQGAALSIDYAVKHPDKVSHLILFSGYASGWRAEGDPKLRKKMEAIIALAESGWEQDNPAFRQFFSMTFIPDACQQELEWFNEYLYLAANAKNAAGLMSAFADLDVRDKLAQVTVPTLVIHSLGDNAVPALSGREIAATIPGAEFIGLDTTSHFLLDREPSAQVFIDVIQEFISNN